MTLRIVADTNVVLSALIFEKGHVAWIRAAWAGGRCCPLVSRATVEELVRALSYPKFNLTSEERDELLGDYLPFSEQTAVDEVPSNLPRCSDPDDQKFLELALVGQASMLVTGDKALLALSGAFPFEILQPSRAHERIDR